MDVGYKFGECDFVGYTTVRDGKTERYIHRFKKRSRPSLVSAHDGSEIRMVGGSYEFTDAGITDK